jgi:hypothetical protein
MAKDCTLEILPSGHIKFQRGSKEHNEKMKSIILSIVGEDEDIINQLNEFFEGSEDVELLVGDTILCG